jgi:hypothetical protein
MALCIPQRLEEVATTTWRQTPQQETRLLERNRVLATKYIRISELAEEAK